MRFTLTIDLGNDAMRSWRHIAAALRVVASTVGGLGPMTVDSGRIRDVNGNTVGQWEITP